MSIRSVLEIKVWVEIKCQSLDDAAFDVGGGAKPLKSRVASNW